MNGRGKMHSEPSARARKGGAPARPQSDPTDVLAGLERMRAEFRRMRDDLVSAIEDEEERSGITDPEHFAYPTFAKAARMRAKGLEEGIARIEGQIAGIKSDLMA